MSEEVALQVFTCVQHYSHVVVHQVNICLNMYLIKNNLLKLAYEVGVGHFDTGI